MQNGEHIISLSLGGVSEPSGIVVLDPRTKFEKHDSENHFNVTWADRFPAGRPIPALVAKVSELMSLERLVLAIEDALSDDQIDDEQKLQNIGERVASVTDGR